MITKEQIPEEVAKALQREFDEHGVFLSLGSAAATLKAWPGLLHDHGFFYDEAENAVILPLQKNTDVSA